MKQQIYFNKYVLVSGASTRTGRAVAKYLLENGANLFLNYRNNQVGVESLIKEFPNSKVWAVQADVSSQESVKDLLKQVSSKTDHLDGLINTVGEYIELPVSDTDFDDWQRMIQNNLNSVFLMCKGFHSLLQKSEGGRIINLGYSNADKLVASRCVAYHIAKTGVLILSKTLASEWASQKITVNTISPGTLFNSVTKDSHNPSDYIPAGRFGEYRDIWPILDLLFRPDSDYLTGNNFILSGGYNI